MKELSVLKSALAFYGSEGYRFESYQGHKAESRHQQGLQRKKGGKKVKNSRTKSRTKVKGLVKVCPRILPSFFPLFERHFFSQKLNYSPSKFSL